MVLPSTLVPSRVRAIRITPNQLSLTLLTIKGFNQVEQKDLDTICLKVELDDLHIDAVFPVIEAHTSYSAFFGWSPLHTGKVIALTLHKCLKYTIEHVMRGESKGMQIISIKKTLIKFYKLANFRTSKFL